MSIIDDIVGTKLTISKGKTFDLLEIFNVNPDDLSNAFAQQAALYAYFSTLQAEAERQLSISKFAVDQEYANADEFYRQDMERQEKKYTETVIKSLVIRDEDYTKKENSRITLEYEVNLLKSITRALAQRGDMLISLGAMTRQELSMTGMTMRDKAMDDMPKDVKSAIGAMRKMRKDQV